MTDFNPFDQLQQLLGAAGTERSAQLPANSRYRLIPTAIGTDAAGRTVIYLRRRFLPNPDRMGTLREATVQQGDRLDNLAAEHLGDPELFWKLCDASRALVPEELEVPGTRLRVPAPDGVPGIPG